LGASTLQPELAPLGRGDSGDNEFLHQGIIILGCYLGSGGPCAASGGVLVFCGQNSILRQVFSF